MRRYGQNGLTLDELEQSHPLTWIKGHVVHDLVSRVRELEVMLDVAQGAVGCLCHTVKTGKCYGCEVRRKIDALLSEASDQTDTGAKR